VDRQRLRDPLAAPILGLLALADSTDLNLVLRRILRVARTAAGARYAALGVPDGHGGFARFLTQGITPRQAERIGALPHAHGVLGALLDGGPIVLRDIRTHPRFSYFPAHHPVMTDFLGVPITHRGAVLGNLFFSGSRSGAFRAADRRTVENFAAYAGVALANADMYTRAQQLAVIEERSRVAGELHDAASQRLFSLVYEARAAGLRATDAETSAAFGRLEAGATEALGELRALVLALRPKSLERDGLAATLRDHVDALRRTHALDMQVETAADLGLTLEQEHMLLRIAQEAIHNVVKHAPLAPARVRLQRLGSRTVLTVGDQGPGFDPVAHSNTERTLGMTTMRERAATLGAAIDVRSAPGRGTTVTVAVRLPRRRS
jgi:signal transduction histidine kinase